MNAATRAGSLVFLTLLCSASTLFYQCATPAECSKQSASGNAGSLLNSVADDYALSRFDNSLLFTSSRARETDESNTLDVKQREVLYEALRRVDASFSPATVNHSLPVNELWGSTPAYSKWFDTSRTIIFTRSLSQNPKNQNADLFQSVFSAGAWSSAERLDNVNSAWWESQPALSADGTILVFASDRPGGYGGIDLYCSLRGANGWSAPRNLGKEINSTADEITPFVDNSGELYYASNYSPDKHLKRGFELKRASQAGSIASWKASEFLPEPFNSTLDDISPLLWGDTLLCSSNRPGGCGGYDIYAFERCGPVMLRGIVMPSKTITRRGGVVTVLDSSGKFAQSSVSDNGEFSVRLLAGRHYVLRYLNNCAPHILEQEFTAPCSELQSVVLKSQFQLPEVNNEFSFEDYDIPFFSSGYYVPNTNDQLNALRLSFAYNLNAIADSTSYIRPPGDELQDTAPLIDSALNRAVAFVLNDLEYRRRGCNTSTGKLQIRVEGFADARSFSASARYAGETIEDELFEFYTNRGQPMTNELLAKLRAYYTAKLIEQRLSSSDLYQQLRKRIQWIISGGGTDASGAPDVLKRRVELRVHSAR